MKYVRLLFFAPLLMAFQCDVESELMEDNLNETGLFGRWEIADETINGISDGLPKCCEYFEFNPDDYKDDLTGLFIYTDSFGANYNGAFTVDEANQLILFEQNDNSPVIYEFSLDTSEEYLTFTFTEDTLTYVQGWVKQN